MQSPLMDRAQNILHLLNISGKTNEYKKQKNLLSAREVEVLKTLKRQAAQRRTKDKRRHYIHRVVPASKMFDEITKMPDPHQTSTIDVWKGFLEEARQNETYDRYRLIELLVNDIQHKTSLLAKEPCNEVLKDEVHMTLSKLEISTDTDLLKVANTRVVRSSYRGDDTHVVISKGVSCLKKSSTKEKTTQQARTEMSQTCNLY